MESKSTPSGEEELAPEAFVVRFGLMRVADLREAIVRCYQTLGFHGLSGYGENRMTAEEIANLAKKPHRHMRKTQVAKLRKLGLEVERRGRSPTSL